MSDARRPIAGRPVGRDAVGEEARKVVRRNRLSLTTQGVPAEHVPVTVGGAAAGGIARVVSGKVDRPDIRYARGWLAILPAKRNPSSMRLE